ncbi:MAG: hypothetical protein K6T30_03180 [Alicyclobacillus sp.]|nr:hypothetical protein [Alicyclobacillus sp.]
MKQIRRLGWLAGLALIMAPAVAMAATIKSNVVTVTGGYYPVIGYQNVPIQQCGWQQVQTGTTQQCQQVQVGTTQQCQQVYFGCQAGNNPVIIDAPESECNPSEIYEGHPVYTTQCQNVPVYQTQCQNVPVYQNEYVCQMIGYTSQPVYGSWVPTTVS